MGIKVRSVSHSELSAEARMLEQAAKEASRAAVAQAFAAGLSIVIAKDGNLVRVHPDGTEEIMRPLMERGVNG